MCRQQSDHTPKALNWRMNRVRDRNVQDIQPRSGMNGRRKSVPELREVVDNLVGIDCWSWQEYRWCTHSDQDWRLHLFEKVIFRFLEVQPTRRVFPFTEILVDGLFDLRKVIDKSPIQVIQAFRDGPLSGTWPASKLVYR
jgi:hypothetical protein